MEIPEGIAEEGQAREVTVVLFAWLRQLFGERQLRVPLRDARDLGQLLRTLCTTPEHRRGLLQDSGRPREDLIVLVNGHNAALMAGEHTSMRPGDLVAVFPSIYGG